MLKTTKALTFCFLFGSVVCFAGGSNGFDKQFDDIYGTSPLLNLPLEYRGWGGSVIDSVEFTDLPESLFPIFKFNEEIYEKVLYMVKLPEYKKMKVIIIRAYTLSGAGELYLCTVQNNKLIDKLDIYSEGEVEYNGRTESISLTSFSITKNYNIIIKNSLIPNPSKRDKELNVERWTYIINKSGKFVEK